MKKSYTFLLPALLLAACTEGNELVDPMAEGAMEITSITAEIGEAITRAGSGNTDYVGRSEFVKAGDANNASGDVMLLTTMKRSDHPIAAFTYSNVKFSCNNNGGWDRTFGDGLETSDRIFWSDNKTGHTFIGYSTPMAWKADKWVQSGSEFSGAFTYTTEGDKKIVDFTTDQKLKDEDILLTHSNEVKAEANGLSTKIHFKHALASLRVIVNINDFSPSSTSEDVKTKIYDLVVMNQPYKYKWTQTPREVGGLQIPGWGVENTTSADDVVEIKTWQPHPEGEGEAEARIFTFYSLIVPGIQNNFEIGYKVKYPKYSNPENEWTIENYDAKLLDANGNPAEIKFLPGYCTTVKVSLNHRGEPIYLGALYIDWEDQITPDKSELKKISTFLDKASPTYDGGGYMIVSIASDKELATPDDATWLYYKTVYNENNQSSEVLVDGYGNDGTQEHPFTIKTAREFLSFAYEVKDGRDFKGQFIILDSDLFLQESINKTTVTWPGIGDADHPFNGTFIGGHRKIKYLQGSPLFYSLGENAHVGHLILEEIISCTGNGVFAETNKGLIGASMVGSRRFNTTNPGAFTLTTSAAPAGAFCGTNNGVLLACYSNAMFKVSGSATSVGGLVGQNTGTGTMVSCYAAGGIDGVSSPMGVAGSNTGTMKFCLFDKDKNTKTEVSIPDGETEGKDGTGAIAKTTLVMQQPEIVGARTSTEATSLNGNLHAWIENDTNVSLLGKFFPTGTTKTQIQAHMSDIYYNYFVAAYPSIH